jgi:hypothetical protein
MARERPPEAHDVLLIPKLRPRSTAAEDTAEPTGILKMAVTQDGNYEGSELLNVRDSGGRKVYDIARPGPNHGPAFAVLPIRPEPGTQADTCYLINTENLFLPNPWTARDWDAPPLEGDIHSDLPPDSQPAATTPASDDGSSPWPAEGFELLVAGPRGKVFLVRCDGSSGSIQEIDVSRETDIWSQLREGLIVGTVQYAAEQRVVPMVNVTSLDASRGQTTKTADQGGKS